MQVLSHFAMFAKPVDRSLRVGFGTLSPLPFMRFMLISEWPHPGSEAWASLVGQKRLRGETKIDDFSRVPGTSHFVVVVKGKPQRHRNFS